VRLRKTTEKCTILIDMKLRPQRKILLLALAVCIVFSFVFAEVLIAKEHDHDCIGEGCPSCLLIEIANIFLKSLKLGGLSGFLAVCPALPVLSFQKYTEIAHCGFSPVTLKVRFNT
jgi:hypothetical protein